jgi:hypothetical protein
MKQLARLEDDIHSSGWSILIILSCLGLIVMFDETMILPAIPDFIHNFNISYSTILDTVCLHNCSSSHDANWRQAV